MRQSKHQRFVIGVVILAAGSSRRMGHPKLLLPWADTTVLGYLLRQWHSMRVAQVAVVHPPGAPNLDAELDRLGFPESDRILNPQPEHGMFSSVRLASAWAGWRADLTHWAITLGDQPHLRDETLQALLECGAANPEKICQPLLAGHRKHPVLLPRAAFAILKDSSASDMKQFLQEHASEWAGFECGDPGLGLDMDTPAEYEQAQRLWAARRG